MPERKQKRIPSLNPLWFLLGLFLCLILWEAIAFGTGQKFLPEFFQCLAQMNVHLGEKATWVALGWSLLRVLISLAVSGILGIVLGLLAGYYPVIGKILAPLMTILRSFPTIALILLLAVYVPHFGLYVTGVVLFPVLYEATYEGAMKTYQQYEYDLLLKGKNHLSNITKIILPLSSSYILLGFMQAMGLGIKVEIMSETFAYSSTYQGLGKTIYMYYQNVEYKEMMSYVLLAVLVSLILDGILLGVQRKVEKETGVTREESRRFWLGF